MDLRRLLLILLSALSLHLQALCEAGETVALSEDYRSYRTARNSQVPRSNTTGFILKYALITANSPDCEPSLVDNFPVGVQYRTISGSDGVSEWMDLYSPNMPGKHQVHSSQDINKYT